MARNQAQFYKGRSMTVFIQQHGCEHNRIVCDGGRAAVEEPGFYWVNTILGNLKTALRSTYHAIRPKYACLLPAISRRADTALPFPNFNIA